MYWSLPKAYGSWSWRTIREWWFWWICRWLKNNMFLSFSCRSPCYWNSIWPFIDSCQSPTSSLFFFTHHCESLCSLSLSLCLTFFATEEARACCSTCCLSLFFFVGHSLWVRWTAEKALHTGAEFHYHSHWKWATWSPSLWTYRHALVWSSFGFF